MPTKRDQSEDDQSDWQGHPLETFDLFTEYRIALNNLLLSAVLNVVFLLALGISSFVFIWLTFGYQEGERELKFGFMDVTLETNVTMDLTDFVATGCPTLVLGNLTESTSFEVCSSFGNLSLLFISVSNFLPHPFKYSAIKIIAGVIILHNAASIFVTARIKETIGLT